MLIMEPVLQPRTKWWRRLGNFQLALWLAEFSNCGLGRLVQSLLGGSHSRLRLYGIH